MMCINPDASVVLHFSPRTSASPEASQRVVATYFRQNYTCLLQQNGSPSTIYYRPQTINESLPKTTDDNLQPYRTERNSHFVRLRSVDGIPFRSVPSGKATWERLGVLTSSRKCLTYFDLTFTLFCETICHLGLAVGKHTQYAKFAERLDIEGQIRASPRILMILNFDRVTALRQTLFLLFIDTVIHIVNALDCVQALRICMNDQICSLAWEARRSSCGTVSHQDQKCSSRNLHMCQTTLLALHSSIHSAFIPRCDCQRSTNYGLKRRCALIRGNIFEHPCSASGDIEIGDHKKLTNYYFSTHSSLAQTNHRRHKSQHKNQRSKLGRSDQWRRPASPNDVKNNESVDLHFDDFLIDKHEFANTDETPDDDQHFDNTKFFVNLDDHEQFVASWRKDHDGQPTPNGRKMSSHSSCSTLYKKCQRHVACRNLWSLYRDKCRVENYVCEMPSKYCKISTISAVTKAVFHRKDCKEAYEGMQWTGLNSCHCDDDHSLHGPECHWIELLTSHNKCIAVSLTSISARARDYFDVGITKWSMLVFTNIFHTLKKSRGSQLRFSRGQPGVSRVSLEEFTPPPYVHQWLVEELKAEGFLSMMNNFTYNGNNVPLPSVYAPKDYDDALDRNPVTARIVPMSSTYTTARTLTKLVTSTPSMSSVSTTFLSAQLPLVLGAELVDPSAAGFNATHQPPLFIQFSRKTFETVVASEKSLSTFMSTTKIDADVRNSSRTSAVTTTTTERSARRKIVPFTRPKTSTTMTPSTQRRTTPIGAVLMPTKMNFSRFVSFNEVLFGKNHFRIAYDANKIWSSARTYFRLL
uniref:GDNF/GAS1 domain-containing protein n=1 Tax=Romanomermis culicivorax TaxID=13658 RepID=A0A915K5V4_ROMCU